MESTSHKGTMQNLPSSNFCLKAQLRIKKPLRTEIFREYQEVLFDTQETVDKYKRKSYFMQKQAEICVWQGTSQTKSPALSNFSTPNNQLHFKQKNQLLLGFRCHATSDTTLNYTL